VARHILEHCILGVLSSKTVVLATHNLHVLEQVSQSAEACMTLPVH
jgi:hypothetical protein